MPTNQTSKKQKSAGHVQIDTQADILQGTFLHYYSMAMDHHTKAGSTSSMLLFIVGALLGLIGLDNNISGTSDLLSGLAILIIGVFGGIWALKQHERYYYWEHIAYEYQRELTKITPDLKPGDRNGEYAYAARDAAVKKFGSFVAKTVRDEYLWVSLHGIVAVIGLALVIAVLF